jgi:replicative DNA helicase
MTEVESRVPPMDLEAEASLLTLLAIDASALAHVSAMIGRADFYSSSYGWIFEAMCDVHAAGDTLDSVSVAHRLREIDRLPQVGGISGLTDALRHGVSNANAVRYARIIRSKARRRASIAAAQRIAAEGYAGGEPDDEFLARAERLMSEATRLSDSDTLTGNAETLAELVRGILRAQQTGSSVTGLPTGLDRYDRMTLGLHSKQLTVVGARPGAGKSALGGTVAVNVARAGVGVLFFSLEMSRDEIIARAVSGAGRIDGTLLKTGLLSPTQWERLHTAAQTVNALPLWVDDKTGVTVQDIRARAFGAIEQTKRMKTALGLIVVDYLQKVAVPVPDRRKGRYEQVGDIARGMKQLARETSLPVICLAQIRRGEKGKDHKAPTMDDLRESGDIEQEADNVTLIHVTEDDGRELLIEKARGGRRGKVEVAWRPELTLFENAPDHGYQEHAAQ